MTVILRKDLGEAGAFLGDKSGPYADLLRDVLAEIVQGSPGDLKGHVAGAISTGQIAAMLAKRACKLTGLSILVATTGTAGSTVVEVQVEGAAKGSLTIDNAEADGTRKTLALDEDVAAEENIVIEVTTAPTAGADLIATAHVGPDIDVET